MTTFKKLALSTLAIGALAAGAISTASAAIVYEQEVVIPVCHIVAVPFVNPYTGWTVMGWRRVCN